MVAALATLLDGEGGTSSIGCVGLGRIPCHDNHIGPLIQRPVAISGIVLAHDKGVRLDGFPAVAATARP